MRLYIVTYDIPCDKRRKKTANLLEGYGQRVQLSVFECFLNPQKYEELKQRLERVVKLEEDSIRFYPLSGRTLADVELWGGVPLSAPPTSQII